MRKNHLQLPVKKNGVALVPPSCSIGITDGSERGDYVAQDHLFRQFGRPHHAVNLMFQYYPDMEGWPTQGVKWRGFYRNTNLNKGDGYFPLVLEDRGPWGQQYLRQIEDVRSHGQEPQLTLTLHADTPDEILIRIAESLKPFGRMRIRINHECNGIWFYFNQRWSYKQVNDFFIRFHNILHTHAPEVRTVACWNGPGDAWNQPDNAGSMRGRMTDDQLAPMFRVADIVSFDQYASLHYGWPNPNFDPQHPSESFHLPFDIWWKLLEDFHTLISRVRGPDTRIEVHEVNEDADLAGFEGQAEWVRKIYREILARRLPWLTQVTFYMFRDRGGLGLELEDTDHPEQFRELPSLDAYRQAIKHPYFDMTLQSLAPLPEGAPLRLRWISPEQATGCAFSFILPEKPASLALQLPKEPRLLIKAGSQWHIKPTGTTSIPVRCEAPSLDICVFGLPSDGRNNTPGAFEIELEQAPFLEL